MSRINQLYTGDHRCLAEHHLSHDQILTDAPTDHAGLSRSFAPTDLLATAVGNATLTAMGIKAEEMGVNMFGTRAETNKVMSTEGPRRVDLITVNVEFPFTVSESDRTILKEIGLTNPVYLSVKDSLNVIFTFN